MVPGIRTWTYHSSKWTNRHSTHYVTYCISSKPVPLLSLGRSGTHIPQVDVGSHPCPSPSFPLHIQTVTKGCQPTSQSSAICLLPLVPTAILTGLLSVFKLSPQGLCLNRCFSGRLCTSGFTGRLALFRGL